MQLARDRKLRSALFLCMVLPLVACASDDTGAERQADKIRAVVPPFLTSAPFYIAAAEGFFAAENLDVEFVRLARYVDGLPALAQGQVDVGVGQLTVSVLNAMSGGARIRAVAGSGHLEPDGCAFMGVVVRQGLFGDGQALDPDLLRGSRARIDLVVPQAYWLDRALQSQGLTLNDLEAVNVPAAAMVDGFIGNSFDIVVPTEPQLTRLARFSDESVLWRSIGETDPGYQVSLVFFGPTLLDERPGIGNRLLIALARGMRQYRLGKTERNLDILEQATQLSREELTAMCWVPIDSDGRVRAEGFAGYQQWAEERGLVDRILTDEEMIDRRFLTAANAASRTARD